MTETQIIKQAIAALQYLTEALWRDVRMDKTNIITELRRADELLREIRRQYIHKPTLSALTDWNRGEVKNWNNSRRAMLYASVSCPLIGSQA